MGQTRTETPAPEGPFPGLNVAGYFDSHIGVGEAARQVCAALDEAGVPVAPITLPERRAGAAPPPAPAAPVFDTTLLCVNADAVEGARAWLGDAFAHGPTLAMWWWEVEVFPDRWTRAFDGLDEIWAGSRFVADAIAPVSPVPVVTMPLPVAPREAPRLSREQLGLREGFTFLFIFDFASGFERKNPLGAVEAFGRAFEPGSGAALAIKHVGGEDHPDQLAELERAAAEHPDTHLVSGRLDPERLAGLTRECDCYVSLHRSEGFGLTLAEAVAAGVPVLATGYSGPLDFLTPSSAYLAGYRLVEVGPGNDPYPPGARWAEPDLDEAAALMREVRADPEAARERARLARERLAESHSPMATGRAMAGRLARRAGLAGRGDDSASAGLAELDRRIAASAPIPAVARRNPLRRAARQLVLRLLRPHTVHQRRVDESLARALRTLDERVEGLARAQATLQAQLRRLEGGRGSARPSGSGDGADE